MSYGFIGTGHMGSSLSIALSAVTKDLVLSDLAAEKAAELAAKLGCCSGDATQAAACDYVFIGVKPHLVAEVLGSLKEALGNGRHVIISMAAGVTIASIEAVVGPLPVIRIMPNTPVALGKGVVLYAANVAVTEAEIARFCEDMRACGLVLPIPEDAMDAGCSLTGCGPAYMYQFANGMAKAAAALGIPADQAVALAAQTMSGAAEMLLQSGKEPETLINEVCTPGGSTIEGAKVLRAKDIDGICLETLTAAFKRNQELGK